MLWLEYSNDVTISVVNYHIFLHFLNMLHTERQNHRFYQNDGLVEIRDTSENKA
jgi:hypothetical protein